MANILKTIPINLDLKRVTAQASPIPTLVEGDTGNEFVITLTDGGDPVNLSPYTVHVVFSHPDGTISERTSEVFTDPTLPPPITITGEHNNIVRFVLMDYNCYEGKNNCEIIIRGDTFVTTAQFNFDVRKGILSGGTPEQQEKLPTLMGLIDQASEAAEIATEAASQVTGVVEAEAGRVAAESARVNAEAERVAADAERDAKVNAVYDAYTSGALKGEQGIQGEQGLPGEPGAVQSVDGVQPNADKTLTLSAVRYVAQSLNDSQKAQARTNISAAAIGANGKVVADQATSARGTNVTADKTLAEDDNGKLFLAYQANVIITIPAGLPFGMEVEFCRWSDYTVTFAAASGVTIKSINNALSIANKNGCAVLKKATADEMWILAGDLA